MEHDCLITITCVPRVWPIQHISDIIIYYFVLLSSPNPVISTSLQPLVLFRYIWQNVISYTLDIGDLLAPILKV